jgi:hypothetical protein
VALDGFKGVVRFIPHGYTEDIKALIFVFCIKFLYDLCLTDARTAPACPEIDERIAPGLHIIAEFLSLSVVGHRKVLVVFAFGSFCTGKKRVAESLHTS